MADLEDGEILSSDSDEGAAAVKNKDSIKDSTVNFPPAPLFNYRDSSRREQPKSGNFTQLRHDTYRSGAKQSAHSDSSDTSDEDTPMWQCKKAKYFSRNKEQCMDLASEVCSPPRRSKPLMEDSSGEELVSPVKKRRANNIWGSVLTEQSLTQGLTGVGVEKNELIDASDRNVEKYDFTKAYEDTRPNIAKEIDTHQQPTDPFENVIKNEEDSVEQTDKQRAPKRKRPVKERLTMDYDRPVDDVSGRISVKDRLDYRTESSTHKKSVKDRLGESEENMLEKLDATEEDSENKVVNAILKSLNEPNVDLFTMIVKVIGKKKALDLAKKTENVELAGGLLTNDGARRRTAGGVYIQLLKKEVTKEQNKEIFAEEEKKFKLQLRQKKKARRKKARQLQKMLPQSKYVNSKNVKEAPQDENRMDTGAHSDHEDNSSSGEDDDDAQRDFSEELKLHAAASQKERQKSREMNVSNNSDEFLDLDIDEEYTIE